MAPRQPDPLPGARAKAEMLDAALRMLERDAKVTLRGVGRAVDGSQTTPYLHFGKKRDGGGLQGLLAAVAARGFRMLRDEMTSGVRSDAECGLTGLARAYVRFAQAHRHLFDLMFSSGLADKLHVEGLGMARWEVQVVIQDVIRECQNRGIVDGAESLNRLTQLAWSTVHGVARLLIDGQLQLMDPEADPESFVAEAVRVFLRGVAGAPPVA
jgi:AcrR family transcriptional regulator